MFKSCARMRMSAPCHSFVISIEGAVSIKLRTFYACIHWLFLYSGVKGGALM